MYIEVVLPVPLADTFTYFVPSEYEQMIVPGSMVLVEFGKNKRYSGVVSYIRQTVPEFVEKIKPILAVESSDPVIQRPQISFWKWIADYYLCNLGEVYKAVLPSGLRSESTKPYTPKREICIRFNSQFQDKKNWDKAFELVKRSEKQEKLLLTFIRKAQNQREFTVSKKDLLSDSTFTPTILKSLIDKEILVSFEKEKPRKDVFQGEIATLNSLSTDQEIAYQSIRKSFQEKEVCLLFGVTSSGKTEIYIHLIQQVIQSGRQVLYLLPEIALTQHLTDRLKKFFGDKLGVYHSKVNDNERVEIWNELLNNSGYQIIVGVRSSVFLPFRDLGLVIIDEEHESSYKQQDPAPRYHARNAAIVLAQMHGAKTLLGSATPSLESFYNGEKGKYGLVRLDKRFEESALPKITLVNTKELRRKKKMKGLFSPELIEKISETISEKNQVLLFQNRRGFSPLLSCSTCDWTPKCSRCDVSLTVHKRINRLVCHYCGNTYQIPKKCPECENEELKPLGFGTEKVEEEIKSLFPDISVERMDTDTTKKKKSAEEILDRFEKGKTQILIGTQMISKGLDFGRVGLVGILNADSLMNFPDFRAYERAYQLMEQVSGRAGRREKQGEVILQTSHPEHPIIQLVLNHDYESMYRMQLEERQLFKYPPLYRIISITLKFRNETITQKAAHQFADLLRIKLGERVLGPDKPAISKIQDKFLRKILLKIEVSSSIQILHQIIREAENRLLSEASFKYITIQYDVDPV